MEAKKGIPISVAPKQDKVVRGILVRSGISFIPSDTGYIVSRMTAPLLAALRKLGQGVQVGCHQNKKAR